MNNQQEEKRCHRCLENYVKASEHECIQEKLNEYYASNRVLDIDKSQQEEQEITEKDFEIEIGATLEIHKEADNINSFLASQCFELHQRGVKQQISKILNEAGEELPTDDEIEKDFMYSNLWGQGAKGMRDKASAIIAGRDKQIERLGLDGLVQRGEMDILVEDIEEKDKEISRLSASLLDVAEKSCKQIEELKEDVTGFVEWTIKNKWNGGEAWENQMFWSPDSSSNEALTTEELYSKYKDSKK